MHLRLVLVLVLVQMLRVVGELAPRTKITASWLEKIVVTGLRLGHSSLYPRLGEPKLYHF